MYVETRQDLLLRANLVVAQLSGPVGPDVKAKLRANFEQRYGKLAKSEPVVASQKFPKVRWLEVTMQWPD